MLPFTSGHSDLDVQRSLELASAAMHIAIGYSFDNAGNENKEGNNGDMGNGVLKTGGNLVMKIFEASYFVQF